MSSPNIQSVYIVQEPGICGGQPRIAGTRIKVQQVALEYERMGWSPDQICDSHPELSLAQVHAAISYYYDHQAEIGRSLREDEEFADRLRAELR